MRDKRIWQCGAARAAPIHARSTTLVQAIATATLRANYDALLNDFRFNHALGHGENT